MDMMIGDVKTDLTEGEHAEEMAHKDYENLMASSQKTRATNAESITEKESASAEWMEKIEVAKTEQASTTEALAKLKEYIAGLHSSCDFPDRELRVAQGGADQRGGGPEEREV